jgi:putative oxidoreductase
MLSVLRFIAAFLFMAHGAQKLFGFLAEPGRGTAPLLSQMGIGGALELFGGFLLLIGLFTRPVAFILSGMMAVAYFQMHAPNGFWPIQNHGELAVVYCFLFLFLSVAGGGEWSLDHLWTKLSASHRRQDFPRTPAVQH